MQTWIAISILLLASLEASAQCNAPSSFGLVPPQTSTALVLKWSPVVGATQYQLRYWATATPDDKTIVTDCGSSPFILRGLRKNSAYTLEIRSKCGTETSAWTAPLNAATINSSGSCNASPSGVAVVADTNFINVSWSSTGSHTIRYRKGDSGDWLIPPGAVSIIGPSYTIAGLLPGMYQVGIKRNCSATSSDFIITSMVIAGTCNTPGAPNVTPGVTNAWVELPELTDVLYYNVSYKTDAGANWISTGDQVLPPGYNLNPPLTPSTSYQVAIQAVCTSMSSAFSPPSSFTTEPIGPCLTNKNYSINLGPDDILEVDQWYNTPSPFNFASMIGVNDGGLVFRSFQNENSNQITQLTTQLRNFHTMDEDFNASPVSYAQNIKPKNTIPEGTPAHTARNKVFYTKYRQTHGFSNITGATEILQYSPQTWKEKIYQESDWSLSGPTGIMQSYKNYTQTFIDQLAPANGSGTQILVSNYQVGNELWDYPIKADYHSLLQGAYGAFLSKYGPKSAGGWKMKLVAGAFQAYRESNCTSMLRDFSNCDSDLKRHDFIGDYLELTDCELLRDLDAIDCHPYSFKPATNTWTFPEDPESETWQIRNLAAWLYANQNTATGVLSNTHLWSTEFGFDSNPVTGVGEKTHSAYLLRGLLMHSRYHYEKVFFYNAYDVARPTDQYYNGLYNSSGFWRLGTHPANTAWASPIEAFGATAKPAWYGMLDFKARFGDHVFFKALVEDTDLIAILIAKPDSTEPYLLFWSPSQTNDANLHQNIPINKTIDWSGAFGEDLTPASFQAQTFAETMAPGQAFDAVSIAACGSLLLNTIQRSPAFIKLESCDACPKINSFLRHAHTMPVCNPNGDYFYEVMMDQVTANEQVTLSGLPTNGFHVELSVLNGTILTPTTFLDNLHFVDNSTMKWQLNTANGSNQSLRLYYCWADAYPNPVGLTTATSLCSGLTSPCIDSPNRTDPGGDRGDSFAKPGSEPFRFSVAPNPGTDHLALTYAGDPASQASLHIMTALGQCLSTHQISNLENQQQWDINTGDLPSGVYFICLRTAVAVKWLVWEKA